jgi:hypothetical protein
MNKFLTVHKKTIYEIPIIALFIFSHIQMALHIKN